MLNTEHSFAVHLGNNTVELAETQKRNKHRHRQGKATTEEQGDRPDLFKWKESRLK